MCLLAPRPGPRFLPPMQGVGGGTGWCVVRVSALALTLSLGGTMGEVLGLSVPQFPHQRNRDTSASEGGCKAQTEFRNDLPFIRYKGYEYQASFSCEPKGCPWRPASHTATFWVGARHRQRTGMEPEIPVPSSRGTCWGSQAPPLQSGTKNTFRPGLSPRHSAGA